MILCLSTDPKQKWVPLDIDLAKSCGKRERSPKFSGGHYRERNGYHGKCCVYIFCL